MSDDANNPPQHHPLQRDPTAPHGMNPVELQTSFYGADGKRIRHIVHKGALQLPESVLNIMIADVESKKEYQLPSLDEVKRPSVDQQTYTVTNVRREEFTQDVIVEGLPQQRKMVRYIFQNQTVIHKEEAERIRGGGGGEGEEHQQQDTAVPMQIDSPVAAAAATTNNPPAPAPPTQSQSTVLSTTITTAPTTTAPTTGSAAPLTTTAGVAAPMTAAVKPTVEVSMGVTASAPTTSAPVPTTNISAPKADTVSASEDANAAVPSTVTSTPAPPQPKVVPLDKRPSPQWQQLKPTSTDEVPKMDPMSKAPKPDWFQADQASDLERALLPEWFDGSAVHRTPETYIAVRSKIIDMSEQLGHNRFVTSTLVRRSIPGDAGSLVRLHSFLISHALINQDAVNDTAPSPMVLHRQDVSQKLMQVVVEESRKKPKIDWQNVANAVGHGMSSTDCERQFMALPMDGTVTPESSELQSTATAPFNVFGDLTAASADPKVLSNVLKVAFESTDNLAQAQKATVAGLLANKAARDARSDDVSRIMAEVVDLRMKKLENRLALLEDVEGMLEAERIALNLERRDLYTARCRHWFGGT